MQNPFSTTFSRLPERSYVSTTAPKDIIENFSYDNPTEAVYKITGLRGSGKTVILSAVQKHFSTKDILVSIHRTFRNTSKNTEYNTYNGREKS